MTLMLFSGARRKMFHEKNLKQKSLDTLPLIKKDFKRQFFTINIFIFIATL
jgi:hypothetical protein